MEGSHEESQDSIGRVRRIVKETGISARAFGRAFIVTERYFMDKIGSIGTYLEAMEEALSQKALILETLHMLTKEQEGALSQKEFNMEAFGQLMDAKQKLLNQMEKLDEGFEQVYARVREELQGSPGSYRVVLERIQERIRGLMEAGVALEALELRNQQKVDRYLAASRDKIRSYKVSNRAAAHYYKSMADQHPGESIFIDKKK